MAQRNRRRQRRRGGIGSKLALRRRRPLRRGRARPRSRSPPGCSTSPPRRPRWRPARRSTARGNSVDLRRRRQQAGADRVRRGARAGLDRARPQAAAAGHGRDRGPALLRARRHRPRGHRPRRAEEPRSRQDRRGRLDDHPAAGPQPLPPQPQARPRTQDHRGEAGDRVRRAPLAQADPRPVPQHRLLRDGRRIDRDRRPGGLEDLLLQAGLEADPRAGGAAGRPAAGALRIQPDPPPRARRGERRNAVLAKMANLGYLSPPAPGRPKQRGLGLDVSGSYFAHREPFFFDYVEHELIERYGVETVRDGGLEVHTTLRAAPAGSRAGSDALGPALLDRPLLGAGLDRPGQRRDRVDGLQLELRLEPVQPRRPGPPPARLDLQDLRPDHGDQAGHRPLLDLLHLETAQPRPAQVGPLGRPHRRRGLPRQGQPAAGDGRLRQHRLRPARPRRRAGAGRRDGALAGDHQPARRDPGRGHRRPADRRLAAGNGRAPTRPWPPAASATTRSRSSGSTSPAAGPSGPTASRRAGSSPKRSPTR